MTTYTSGEVAGLTGLSTAQIRKLARHGIIGDKQKRSYRFRFPDLLLLKTARRLLEGGARFADICRALEAIRRRIGRKMPATAVAVKTAGREVLVADAGIVWNPATGQVQLDFKAAATAPVGRPTTVQEIDASDADDWFDRGCVNEAEGKLDAAHAAYTRALRLDAAHVDARINRGRLAALRGETADAERDYRAALKHDPDSAIGWFNLGVLYDDQKRYEDALKNYRRSIEADPKFPDAHYNLALLCEKADPVTALRHLKAYQQIAD